MDTRRSAIALEEPVEIGAHPISWGAILAGSVTALSVHLLLTTLGVGVGMWAIDPLRDHSPVKELSLAAGIAWTISALISLWLGGWVAGKAAHRSDRKTGGLHGLVVWSVATVVTFFAVSAGTSAAVKGAATVVGKTASAAGQALSTAAQTAGEAGVLPDGDKMISGFVQEVAPAAGSNARELDPRAKREISWALFRLFSNTEPARQAENREGVITALVERGGQNREAAQKTVDEWITARERMQKDLAAVKESAELKAREVADRSAKAAGAIAVWTFIAFAIGAAVSTWGGRKGATTNEETYVDTTTTGVHATRHA